MLFHNDIGEFGIPAREGEEWFPAENGNITLDYQRFTMNSSGHGLWWENII